MLLVNYHYLWLGDQQLLVCLEIKVPQDIGQRWFRGDSHRDLGTLKPQMCLFYPSHLAVPLSVYCPSLHLISLYMLDSLRGTFAQTATWVPFGFGRLWPLVVRACSYAALIKASVLSFQLSLGTLDE